MTLVGVVEVQLTYTFLEPERHHEQAKDFA